MKLISRLRKENLKNLYHIHSKVIKSFTLDTHLIPTYQFYSSSFSLYFTAWSKLQCKITMLYLHQESYQTTLYALATVSIFHSEPAEL